MEFLKFLWSLKDVTLADFFFLWLRVAALASMVLAAIGMFGFRKAFRYVYLLIAISLVTGVLLSAAKG